MSACVPTVECSTTVQRGNIHVTQEPVGVVSGVVELRRYTLHPGARDTLVELFDRAFVESQEALGIELIGQFRDLDRDDRFVWLRGFTDMTSREQALGAFYGGPVWAEHRDAANATMIDSDDVYLLRPVTVAGAEPSTTGGTLGATIYHLRDPAESGFLAWFQDRLAPELIASGEAISHVFVTEPAENTFPALPVREGEHVLVWVGRSARVALESEVNTHLTRAPEVLRLQPTPRSRLR